MAYLFKDVVLGYCNNKKEGDAFFRRARLCGFMRLNFMTITQLLKRKEVIENQVKRYEERIVTEKNSDREKLLFERINLLGKSLERVNSLLAA